jgi:hypothetical protein
MLVSTTDLRLQQLSPCINAGTSSFGVALDILGNSRLCNPDIGAYEYRGEPSWASYDNVWTGCDSDNWHNPNNWLTNDAPNATQTVLIPKMPNNPVVTPGKPALCKTLEIDTDNGAIVNIDVDGGASLEITEP